MSQSYTFDYFYQNEAEQFHFYRIPKALFTGEHFRELSCESKVLYGLLLDRTCLSARNQWLDEQKRVFIYFTIERIQEYIGCAHGKAVKLLAELESIGLIEKKKQGQGNPARIYVKQFAKIETSEIKKSGTEVSQNEVQKSDNRKSRSLKNGSQDFPESAGNNTDFNDTELNNTDSPSPSFSSSQNVREQSSDHEPEKEIEMDAIDAYTAYREVIKDNIGYEFLLEQQDKERLDELVELMLEVVCSPKKTYRIAKADLPAEVVKSRLMKLNQFHIEFVFQCLDENTSKVYRIKNYLLTVLYNAPTTMSNYYSAKVSHDLYGDPGQ